MAIFAPKTYLKYMVMKKIFLIGLPVMLLFGSGCLKSNECKPKSVQSEEGAITAFAAANSITATRHSSGLYYQIINPGSGVTPTISSRIYVTYVGKLLDGTIFDQQSNSSQTGFYLSQVVPGWQIALPLIQKGGQIKFIVPSSLGYGCTAQGPIPANAVLYFDVTLVDVQ
jgi:FKBP-type peptidyl-prolyl cis-trans isomerase FkpA